MPFSIHESAFGDYKQVGSKSSFYIFDFQELVVLVPKIKPILKQTYFAILNTIIFIGGGVFLVDRIVFQNWANFDQNFISRFESTV